MLSTTPHLGRCVPRPLSMADACRLCTRRTYARAPQKVCNATHFESQDAVEGPDMLQEAGWLGGANEPSQCDRRRRLCRGAENHKDVSITHGTEKKKHCTSADMLEFHGRDEAMRKHTNPEGTSERGTICVATCVCQPCWCWALHGGTDACNRSLSTLNHSPWRQAELRGRQSPPAAPSLQRRNPRPCFSASLSSKPATGGCSRGCSSSARCTSCIHFSARGPRRRPRRLRCSCKLPA